MPLIRRVPWAVQPPGVARVRWGNSLTRGLQFLVTPAGNLLAASGLQPFTFIGSGRIEPGPEGLAVRSIYTGTGANEATIPVVANASGDRTLVAYAGNLGTAVNDFPTQRIADADSTDYLCFGSTTFRALIDNNFAPAITIVQSSQPRIGAARRRTNQCSGWFDGIASAEIVTGTRAMTATSARIGRDGSSNSFDSQTYWLAYWDRYLNDAELASLRVDPWQLFEPLRILIPVSAGAGGGISGTLSQTLAGLTSSAAGTLALAGTASQTLAAVTYAATGTLALSGTTTQTLGALALTAAGQLQAAGTGTLAQTLADATLSATGKLALAAALSRTLDAATLSATGVLGSVITGALSATLSDVTASATGRCNIAASLGITLGDLTVSATGRLQIAGVVGATLQGATLSATGLDPGASVAVYPDPAVVLAGIQYGPTGADYTGTLAAGLTVAQATYLLEVWQLLGLDSANPLITTRTSIQAGGVLMAIAETAGPTVTLTRAP